MTERLPTDGTAGRMQALVFTGPGAMELQSVPRPEPGNGVLVSVRAAGICGSELHGFRSVGFRKPPLIMGHEFAGETADGRRVVVNPLVSCGHCDLCTAGRPQVCRSRELLGVQRPGGFAERVAVPASTLHDLPDAMSWETAALVEPLANAVHAWRQVADSTGDRVAVVGAGTIGLVCLLVARRAGLDVAVVDVVPERLDLAERLGATECRTSLDGEYDVVVDAVGKASTRRSAVAAVRPAGTAVLIGLAEPEAGFDANDLVRSEKRVVGSFAYAPQDFAEALELAGDVDLDWVTPVSLADSQRTFMALAEGAALPVKAVIRL
jgi:threonine dehydrogenase-like Zn-dependent dehydrogenase